MVKHGEGPSRVDTQLIRDADHIYEGKEEHVATILADWINRLRRLRFSLSLRPIGPNRLQQRGARRASRLSRLSKPVQPFQPLTDLVPTRES